MEELYDSLYKTCRRGFRFNANYVFGDSDPLFFIK